MNNTNANDTTQNLRDDANNPDLSLKSINSKETINMAVKGFTVRENPNPNKSGHISLLSTDQSGSHSTTPTIANVEW